MRSAGASDIPLRIAYAGGVIGGLEATGALTSAEAGEWKRRLDELAQETGAWADEPSQSQGDSVTSSLLTETSKGCRRMLRNGRGGTPFRCVSIPVTSSCPMTWARSFVQLTGTPEVRRESGGGNASSCRQCPLAPGRCTCSSTTPSSASRCNEEPSTRLARRHL